MVGLAEDIIIITTFFPTLFFFFFLLAISYCKEVLNEQSDLTLFLLVLFIVYQA